jgi:uncharacterized membrane protein required for colicin V production
MQEAIRQLNWVDIFVTILLIRICYIAAKCGFPAELFKLLGTLSAIFFAFHNYIPASNSVVNLLKLKEIPIYVDFVMFLSLAIFGYIIFIAVRRLFSLFIKMEAVALLNKWGGLVLGIFRAVILASLVLCLLTISGFEYFKRSIEFSYSGSKIVKIAPAVYKGLWENIISKFIGTQENRTKE